MTMNLKSSLKEIKDFMKIRVVIGKGTVKGKKWELTIARWGTSTAHQFTNKSGITVIETVIKENIEQLSS